MFASISSHLPRWCPAFVAAAVGFAAPLVSLEPALAQFTQQGPKQVGTGAAGAAQQGFSVALSSDGLTAIVGGPADDATVGAAWVFTRSGGVRTQQGPKLVGTGAVGTSAQGYSVALSADGNTAIVGGAGDNSTFGAAWVFTRSNGAWVQQGSKLVGTGAIVAPNQNLNQGISVALSADGNTALVGGQGDNSSVGAAWVFTRSGAVWTQQGPKLVGTDAVSSNQGHAVALSADGNTALIGGPGDNEGAGAAWVFVRNGGVWSQQGSKLVGTGSVGGGTSQGFSVALSADGNTALVGGPIDNAYAGAAWVFTRSGGMWTQQGQKLVGTGATGDYAAQQGRSVALSADGNTAIVGGPSDNPPDGPGAVWVFSRGGGVWTQQGSKLVGTGAVPFNQGVLQGQSVALSADSSTVIAGGPNDNSYAGAAWVFVQLTKEDCKAGGWLNFPSPPGPFTNQGQCVSYFAKRR
jgi:hypothetical protein